MTLASPCRKLCTLDPATRVCRACGRTLDEIAGWGGMDDDARRAVLARIAAAEAREDISGR